MLRVERLFKGKVNQKNARILTFRIGWFENRIKIEQLPFVWLERRLCAAVGLIKVFAQRTSHAAAKREGNGKLAVAAPANVSFCVTPGRFMEAMQMSGKCSQNPSIGHRRC